MRNFRQEKKAKKSVLRIIFLVLDLQTKDFLINVANLFVFTRILQF